MDQEREAWLQHQRDRWNAWTATLGRIKQDEQRWVTVAIAVYGVVVALLGAQGDLLFPRQTGDSGPAPDEFQHLAVLVLALAIVHLFAWAWVRHALVLRLQYYRSMAEVHRASLALRSPIPREWRESCWATWYCTATRPAESKLSEMRLLFVVTAAATVLSALRAGAALCTLDIEHPWLTIGGTVGCAVVSLVVAGAWPWFIYPRWDRRSMRDLYESLEDLWQGEEAQGPAPESRNAEASGAPGDGDD